MLTETMTATFDGVKLYLKTELPDGLKAVAVIVHGLCEHQGRYDYLAERLVANNIGVYRFDHRGHGRSEGTKVYYSDFNEIADDVNVIVDMARQENPGLPVFVIGHSMGGFATTAFATKYSGKANGIVLSGALTRMNLNLAAGLPAELADDTYIPNELGDGVCSDPAVVEAYAKDPFVEKQISIGLFRNLIKGVDWLKANPGKFTEPVLIMHGCNDGLVSEKDSRDLFGEIASKDKKLIIYAGMMHEIFNEYDKDDVIYDTIKWLEKHI